MNAAQFVNKWRSVRLKERAAAQEHFTDLCRVVGHATPAEADQTGASFTFEKKVAKANGRNGWADVWKKDFFAWEYKSPNKSLDAAHDQLRQYREALLNPPLLAACDLEQLVIRTNFTGRPTVEHRIPLTELASPERLQVVEWVFHDPGKLEPGRTVRAITDEAAGGLASIAERMRGRGLDPVQVARFLDRVVFCFFAQDVRLIKEPVFTRIVEKTRHNARWISDEIFRFFRTMDTGGYYALEEIPHFNGDLFADVQPLELTGQDVAAIHQVAGLDWREVDASIFGTLFERGMDPSKRAELGAHYTSLEDIVTIVDPVIMGPLRREWDRLRGELDGLLAAMRKRLPSSRPRASSPKKDPSELRKARALVLDFLGRIQQVTILDPACGSGNFLYVALKKLKDLEKEVLVYASDRNIGDYLPGVGPWQLRGIEKSPYAHDLARMTVWIGWLQWTRANGYEVDWKPILHALDKLHNIDAILDLSDPENPRDPAWPEAEFIVGNPPFLGGKKLRSELGPGYVDAMFRAWRDRVRPEADLCCYWFEKARGQIEAGKCRRAGLLATQGIRGGASRETLKRIQESGDIFFAESDRPWVLGGANVHISMIGFDGGAEAMKRLDGRPVAKVNSDLTASEADVTTARRLATNAGISFMGDTRGGAFDVDDSTARDFLLAPNPSGRPSSDVVLPWSNGWDVTRRHRDRWIIDFGVEAPMFKASQYEMPFDHVRENVYPSRLKNNRQAYRDRWWIHVEARPTMREAIAWLPRFLCTPRVSKHRLFAWQQGPMMPDCQLFVFARSDDYFFGVLHSRLHEVWARSQGTQVRERESGFRYTPTTCFETFPFPEPFAALHAVITEAARQLDGLRENWLNPPEWTREDVLEFPGSVSGPWAHLVRNPDDRGIGTVRYTRRVPRDAECATKLAKRTLTSLYNQRPSWLDLAHRKLDGAVFEAYGWDPSLTDDQVLSRLLALNLERASAEMSTKAPAPIGELADTHGGGI
jgi:hypothetical protein